MSTRKPDSKKTRAELIAERDKWRRLDNEAATHVEIVICMRTHFDGNPPYVGWKGLGLALGEALDERDELRKQVMALRHELRCFERHRPARKFRTSHNRQMEASDG